LEIGEAAGLGARARRTSARHAGYYHCCLCDWGGSSGAHSR